jgi:transposase
MMDVVYPRCCGLDVHKETVVACVQVSQRRRVDKEIRTFKTHTRELLALSDWLQEQKVTHVALESTGVYWKPIYNVLEGQFELLLVNAQHIKAVPGRKTDVKDAEWLADLLRHGLVRGSFVPDREQREVRDLTRYRATLMQDRARQVNRLHKVLQDANLKLSSVISDITGISAREMLQAMLDGQRDVAVLAQMARGKMREKQAQLQEALNGRFTGHHAFLVSELLAHIDYLEAAVERLNEQIEERLRPFEADIQRLDAIPGINRATAQVLLAEIGHDWSRFPTDKHLASWAALCPGHDQSAGRRRSGKTRDGNRWLRQALVEAAQGARHTKQSYFKAQYARIARRRGSNKAIFAVAHSLLVVAYHLITEQTTYRDLGANYYDERQRQALQRNLVKRLERLGFQVHLAAA